MLLLCGKLKCIILHVRHSFCTRLLYTVVPSSAYSGDKTVDALHTALAANPTKAFVDGVEATGCTNNLDTNAC